MRDEKSYRNVHSNYPKVKEGSPNSHFLRTLTKISFLQFIRTTSVRIRNEILFFSLLYSAKEPEIAAFRTTELFFGDEL